MARKISRIDQNELAVKIAKAEGGRQQMNIAQIKECLRCTLDALAEYPQRAVVRLIYETERTKAGDGPNG